MAQASSTNRRNHQWSQAGKTLQMLLRSSNRRRSRRKKACWAALKNIPALTTNLHGSKVQLLPQLLIVSMALAKILCRLMEIKQARSIAKILPRSWQLKESRLLLLVLSPSRHSVVLPIAVMGLKKGPTGNHDDRIVLRIDCRRSNYFRLYFEISLKYKLQ